MRTLPLSDLYKFSTSYPVSAAVMLLSSSQVGTAHRQQDLHLVGPSDTTLLYRERPAGCRAGVAAEPGLVCIQANLSTRGLLALNMPSRNVSGYLAKSKRSVVFSRLVVQSARGKLGPVRCPQAHIGG